MPDDPFLPSAGFVLDQSLKDLRTAIDGLPAEALDWKPAGADTNSAAVLVTHVMHSTRSWLSVAVGAPLPDRDRDSEFLVKQNDPTALMSFLDAFSTDCRAVLKNAGEVDWSATRKTHARPGDTPEEVPAAFALIHALSHLQEHVAHLGLTRQLWETRP
jgi:hypothetical protein